MGLPEEHERQLKLPRPPKVGYGSVDTGTNKMDIQFILENQQAIWNKLLEIEERLHGGYD